jgi:hypothetical protein
MQFNLEKEYSLMLDEEIDIQKEFNKPIFENNFFRSRDALIESSKKIKFDTNRWEQNPFKFCFDHYRTAVYANIILLTNKIPTFLLFNRNNLEIILTPDIFTIKKVLRFK